jgi:hypothetical protein
VRVSVPFPDQAFNPLGEDGSLPGAGAGDNQHGPVDVLNGFALAIVGKERSETANRLRRH